MCKTQLRENGGFVHLRESLNLMKHKKICHDCDRSRRFTRNYVMEVVDAIVFYVEH